MAQNLATKDTIYIIACRLPEAGNWDLTDAFIEWAEANNFDFESDYDEGVCFLEGEDAIRVNPGDWIVKDKTSGKFEALPPAAFAKKYPH